MPAPASRNRLTYAEYLALEARSDTKHEFYGGELFAMAGGTRGHALVQGDVLYALRKRLDGRACRPVGSDGRVYFPAFGEGCYPDAHVVCGPYQHDPADDDACINPTLVVEVLSPSTEAWDRGGKFDRYESLPSVQEYLLVSVETERAELFRRNLDGTWTRSLHRTHEEIPLTSLEIRLPVAEFYVLLRAETQATSSPTSAGPGLPKPTE